VVGLIVKHGGFGLGRIVHVEGRQAIVQFFASGESHRLAGGLQRISLGLETRCITNKGACRIKRRKLGKDSGSPHAYEVEFEDGRLDEISETELTPDGGSPKAGTPLETLLRLQHEAYGVFSCREDLVSAYLQTLRDGLGVRALLSSRIDLRPHQAYVAGVVLLDRQQRYLLADEVGLGETIEAGIIIHDLLSRKTDAQILILCPGALTQQWLSELYGKFCGRIFRMPELTAGKRNNLNGQIILSFTGAIERSRELLENKWDMIIVDEAHHLLTVQKLYDLAQKVSRVTPALLVLSALPAQHREEEYLRLLAILDPQHYDSSKEGAAKQFRELYARQRRLGMVLGWISRKLPEVVAGGRQPESLIEKLSELTTWPVLEDDEQLCAKIRVLTGSVPTFARDVQAILHHVGDSHRINRRILRNRRVRLIAQEQIPAIERRLNRLGYDDRDQFELDAWEFARRLLDRLRREQLDHDVVVSLAPMVFHAASDPDALGELLNVALQVRRSDPIESDRQILILDSVIGYSEWQTYATTLWQLALPLLTADELADAVTAVKRWMEVAESRSRFQTLVQFLKAKHRAEPRAKLIIFAGFPGLAQRLHQQLSIEFATKNISRFYFGMPDEEKDEEARWFRHDEQRWILVSDETGGEGRNFQFVDELIHYDNPWNAARIEQRIGRLDRLGRTRRDVISNVLYCCGVEEEGLIGCLADGLGVYAQSISGLEFALRDIEREVVLAAVSEGRDGLMARVVSVKEAAAAERITDESAEVLDEASFERTAAAVFLHAQSSPAREQRLERAFGQYFKAIASPRAVYFCREADYPEGIVSFQPEDVREVPLGLAPDSAGRIPERRGTFYRAIAQERPDLEFFSVGNSFFDAVCDSLFSTSMGRTYAIESRTALGKWRGFEFVFRVTCREKTGLMQNGLLNQLDRVFGNRLEHVWIGEDGELSTFSDSLLQLRRSLNGSSKGRTWWNLTGEKAHVIETHYAEKGWTALVEQRFQEAQLIGRRRFSEVLAERLTSEHNRLDEQKRQLSVLKPIGWEDDLSAINLLRNAIDGWDVELEALGFLSLNGGLLSVSNAR